MDGPPDGTLWYLLHDATLEAYELGAGPWNLWQRKKPKSRGDVAKVIRSFGVAEPAWVATFSTEIWSFIEGHPKWYLHDDDELYFERDRLELGDPNDDGERFLATHKLFRLVGSRYEDTVLDSELEKTKPRTKPKKRVR